MVSKKLRLLGEFEISVDREKKMKAAFSPFGFLRGGEGVQKYGTERPRMRTGAAVRSGSLGAEDFSTSAGAWT
ncbi:hypothetical protein N9954_04355 [Maribacter sp.]|nr:hypothetical protein [Maribacter sp.]